MQQPDKQGKLSLIRQLLSGNVDLAALRPAQTFFVDHDLVEDVYLVDDKRMNKAAFEAWQTKNFRQDVDMLFITELDRSDEPETVIPEPLPEPVKAKERKTPLQAVKSLFTGTSKKAEVKPQEKQITEPQQPKRAGKLSEYGLTWSCDPMNIEKDLFRQPGSYTRSYQIT